MFPPDLEGKLILAANRGAREYALGRIYAEEVMMDDDGGITVSREGLCKKLELEGFTHSHRVEHTDTDARPELQLIITW